MIPVLPASVESYLKEAGFTATEVMIIKNLLAKDALTLREMATLMTKSTGVLDQAVKKLVSKRIMKRESINGQTKYTLMSLDAIVQWMEKDRQKKSEELERKHQNFESFIASLQLDVHRPKLDHFDSLDGIKKAYASLLAEGTEMLSYCPITCKEEEDALREFRTQYARERQRRGIMLRIIAPDTPLGSRFQSRDPFEYRKTILVPPEELPYTFEKIIVGSTIACIDHAEKRACFIRYGKLAEAERAHFEVLWRRGQQQTAPTGQPVVESRGEAIQMPVELPKKPERSPLASDLGRFFFGRRSVGILVGLAVAAGSITYGLHQYTASLTLKHMGEEAMSIASTGALQINAADLDQLRVEGDWKKPEWAKVVGQLKAIRINNPNIIYVYIFREKASNKNQIEFVSDSHSINPYANIDNDPNNNVDTDGDGKIEVNGADLLQWPGQDFPEPPLGAFAAYNGSTYTKNVSTDQWGSFISGYAPIKNGSGQTVAVLAADVTAGTLKNLTNKTSSWVAYFLIFFFIALVVRLVLFHRPILTELDKIFRLREFFLTKKSVAILVGFVVLSAASTFGLYEYTAALNLRRLGEQAMSVATMGALRLNANDLNQLQIESDWTKPEWPKVVNDLNAIKNNSKIDFVYIIRKNPADKKQMEFVSDAQSLNPLANTDNDPTNDVDLNGDGKIDGNGTDQLIKPGQPYPDVPHEAFDAYNGPTYTKDVYGDGWGLMISGYAPVKDKNGHTVAILSADLQAGTLKNITIDSSSWMAYFFIFFAILILIRFIIFNRDVLMKISNFFRLKEFFFTKRSMVILIGFAFISGAITFGVYEYTSYLNLQRMREKVTSVAATGALQFSSNDIDQLRTHDDIAKPEYAKVIDILNKIRSQNQNIKYTYILRPGAGNVFTFVADADSLDPTAIKDLNDDGKIDAADELNYPGFPYDISQMDVLSSKSYMLPNANKTSYTDQWGTFISGYAPIKGSNNQIAGILAVDVYANEVGDLNRGIFTPVYLFILIFSILIVIRFILLQGEILRKIFTSFQLKKVSVYLGVFIILSAAIAYGFYIHTLYLLQTETATRLMSIASTAASDFDAEDLAQLHFAKDMKTDAYQRVFKKLNQIRDENPGTKFVCIMRRSSFPDAVEFVADADSNYYPIYYEVNGKEVSDEAVPPGTQYDTLYGKSKLFSKAFQSSYAESNYYSDKWGTYLSGAAPIYDKNHKVVAILDLDMDVTDFYKKIQGRFLSWL